MVARPHGRSRANPAPAVVLGVEHPRALAVIRSLGRAGIPVLAFDHEPSPHGFYSRYVNEKHLISEDSERAIDALESVGRRTGGVLISTSDRYLMLASAYHARLSRLFTLTIPPWDILGRLMDKPRCYELGREAGLHVPRAFTPRDPGELESVLEELDLTTHAYVLSMRLPGPGVADSRTHRFTKAAGGDLASLRANCLEIAARTGQLPIIVEVVPGLSDRCIGVTMVVDRDHKPVRVFCVRRLQLYPYFLGRQFVHPYELGANVHCESVIDEEAVEAATRLVRHARFQGVITVEFRRDPVDESLKLIKTDPRVVRATALSTALNLDVPTALYDVFSGRQVRPACVYDERVGWMWPTWFLETLWKNRRRAPLAAQLLTLARDIWRVRAFAYLSWRDPVPALVDGWRRTRMWGRGAVRPVVRKFFPRDSARETLLRALRQWWVAAR